MLIREPSLQQFSDRQARWQSPLFAGGARAGGLGARRGAQATMAQGPTGSKAVEFDMIWRAVLPSICWILPFGMVASYYYQAAASQLGDSVRLSVGTTDLPGSFSKHFFKKLRKTIKTTHRIARQRRSREN